jgi:signal transduction histidine kinase
MDEFVFFKGLFDGMRCALLSFDRDGRIMLINDQASKILNLPESAHTGEALDRVLAEHPQLLNILKDCFGVSHLPNREELVLQTDSGRRTIGYTVSLIASSTGEPLGAAVFFKDLTLIERKEEQERLQERLAALGQMAASLAHEIRNPLAAIEVTCSLLRRMLDDAPESQNLLSKIVAEVRRLNGTITSSLEFVRPVMLTLTRSNPVDLIEEAIETAFGRRGDKRVRFDRNISVALPELLADREQIRQVFENILVNAVEAVEDEGVVTISADVITRPLQDVCLETDGSSERDEHFLIVQITDNGAGIVEEGLTKLFHPFFTTKEQGSGVGLSTAKKIVDCHYGMIDVVNIPGSGARFTVRLPVDCHATEG